MRKVFLTHPALRATVRAAMSEILPPQTHTQHRLAVRRHHPRPVRGGRDADARRPGDGAEAEPAAGLAAQHHQEVRGSGAAGQGGSAAAASPPRLPRPAPEPTPHPPRPRQPEMPRQFLWVVRLLGVEATGCANQLDYLLKDPEMQALLRDAPQVGRHPAAAVSEAGTKARPRPVAAAAAPSAPGQAAPSRTGPRRTGPNRTGRKAVPKASAPHRGAHAKTEVDLPRHGVEEVGRFLVSRADPKTDLTGPPAQARPYRCVYDTYSRGSPAKVRPKPSDDR